MKNLKHGKLFLYSIALIIVFPCIAKDSKVEQKCKLHTECKSLSVCNEMEQHLRLWNHFLISELKSNGQNAQKLNDYAKIHGYPIRVFPSSDTWPANNISMLQDLDGPCGTEILIFSKSLASTELRPFIKDTVLEVDKMGQVLTRWQVPINSQVVGIQNDVLLISNIATPICSAGNPQINIWLAIKPSGDFDILEPKEGISPPDNYDCKNKGEDFRDSDYVRCWEYVDLLKKNKRSLMFQGPCT